MNPHSDPATVRETSPGFRLTLTVLLTLAVWLGIVIYTAAHHEFWRDEVRALTLAREAASPFDLYALARYDGHPVLWFLLLYIGSMLSPSPLILPVISIAVSFAAMALWMTKAPFPLWFRIFFAFSVLPLYEYTVMARNYGISMLLLFLVAWLYPRRDRHPLLIAALLALLANCNAHSLILAGLLLLVWLWDVVRAEDADPVGLRLRRMILPLVIFAAGGALSALFVLPRRSTILTDVYTVTPRRVAYALRNSILRPDDTFRDLLPQALPIFFAVLLLYVAILGLRARPQLAVAAFSAMLALGMLFRVGYPGSLRHQGLLLIFLLVLYWLSLDALKECPAPGAGPQWLQAGLYGSLLLMLLLGMFHGGKAVYRDITGPVSSSRAFSLFLSQSEAYRNAVIVPEPDIYAESLPYYADNPIYLPREQRFARTVSWTTDADAQLSLGELVSRAKAAGEDAGVPALIVLGHLDINDSPERVKQGEYNKVFSWSEAEMARFREATELVAAFTEARGDENYRIYALR